MQIALARAGRTVDHELMAVEHFDVLIIGAGISGIGAGRYLKTELPGKTFAITGPWEKGWL